MLTLEWLKKLGGIKAIEKINQGLEDKIRSWASKGVSPSRTCIKHKVWR